MYTLLKNLLLAALIIVPMLATPAPAAAACAGGNTARGQVEKGLGETGGGCSDKGVGQAIAAFVKILSIVVGIAAVFAIISSGFKYIASGGDSNKIANAKNTLIYALVGLAIAAAAQFLVYYVFTLTTRSI